MVYLPIDQLPEVSLPDEAPIGAARAVELVFVGRKAAVGVRLAGEGGTKEIPGALGLRRRRGEREGDKQVVEKTGGCRATYLVRHMPWRRRMEKVLVGAFNIVVESNKVSVSVVVVVVKCGSCLIWIVEIQ